MKVDGLLGSAGFGCPSTSQPCGYREYAAIREPAPTSQGCRVREGLPLLCNPPNAVATAAAVVLRTHRVCPRVLSLSATSYSLTFAAVGRTFLHDVDQLLATAKGSISRAAPVLEWSSALRLSPAISAQNANSNLRRLPRCLEPAWGPSEEKQQSRPAPTPQFTPLYSTILYPLALVI